MEAVLRDTKHDEYVDMKLKDQMSKVTKEVKDLGRLARISSKQKLERARDHGEHLYDRMRTRSREALRRRPMTSLITAAGLGALAGLLLIRK